VKSWARPGEKLNMPCFLPLAGQIPTREQSGCSGCWSPLRARQRPEPIRVAGLAGSIARLPDLVRPELVSHGDVVRERYGVVGARGEAYTDFPNVVKVGIPALRAARVTGKSETVSRRFSLLSIMAELDDTCVLYRSGLEGGEVVKAGAKAVSSMLQTGL
jgi:triphosphoribosyl-dephospho-CoA synthetase